MNLHPKVRPLWQRAIALPVLTMLMIYKATRLPTFFLPRDIRNIIKHWDFRVLLGADQLGPDPRVHRPAVRIQGAGQLRAEGGGRAEVAAHRKAAAQVLRRRVHRPARCVRSRGDGRLPQGHARSREVGVEDLRVRHAARSPLREPASVGLHEAPGDHRASGPDSGSGPATSGGRRCSTSRRRRRRFSSIRPARSWWKITRCRLCTRPIATRSSS